jgi:hypothetical protein
VKSIEFRPDVPSGEGFGVVVQDAVPGLVPLQPLCGFASEALRVLKEFFIKGKVIRHLFTPPEVNALGIWFF